jgi:hypothetical protein
MSDFLADSIAAPIRPDIAKSPFDHKVLVDAVTALQMNPWIREIHSVRRTYTSTPGDTIEVDCEYRAPVALVKWNDRYTLVDNEGTVLPEQFTEAEVPRIVYGADGKMNIRVIEGVTHKPGSPGQVWPGADVAAGLELVQLLYNQPYADDILKVNVANFQGRRSPRDPQLTLITRFTPATELRWGRPVSAKDAFIEVTPAQKLNYLASVYAKYHRVDQHLMVEGALGDVRADRGGDGVGQEVAHPGRAVLEDDLGGLGVDRHGPLVDVLLELDGRDPDAGRQRDGQQAVQREPAGPLGGLRVAVRLGGRLLFFCFGHMGITLRGPGLNPLSDGSGARL